MSDLQSYYKIVEEAIKSLGVDPAQCRGSEAGQWNLQRKDLVIWIDLWHLEKAGKPFFQVLAPVMTIPENDQGSLFAELLRINNSIFVVSFALHEQYVYLKSIREAEGLTTAEVNSALHYCGYYADYYSERLLQNFGGKKLVQK